MEDDEMSTALEPKNTKGIMRKINGPLSYGFVGLDAYMRVKEGEALPVAAGKALLTNALWGMLPGGQVAAFGLMAGSIAVEAAPMIANAIDRKRAELNQKRSQFGGNFQSTQAQHMMMNHGINQITNARSHLAASMVNHARNAQRVY
jgi:hypothetical protein